MSESHDDILRKHREKFEQHRQWMAQQQADLRDMQVGSTPRESVSQSHAPASAQQAQPQQASNYSAGGGHHDPVTSARGQSWGGGGNKFSEVAAHHSGYPTRSAPRSGSYGGSNQPTGSPLSVHGRSTQWNKRRNQRLEEMRRQRKDETNDECTFTPMVSHRSIERERSASMQSVDPIYVKGYDEFLARQEHAKKIQEERKRRLKSDGSGWRNETTVPEEFQLGNRRPEQLAALQRPIRAPLRHGVNDNHEHVNNEASPLRSRGEQGERNPFEAAGMPPKGTFSEMSSAAIIDVTVLKPGAGTHSPDQY